MVDRKIKSLPNIDSFLVDNISGAYDMTSYLISLGHRRIGIIIGPPITTTGEGRLIGYQKAMREAGIPIEPELVLMGTFQRGSGRQAAQNLLAMENPPTAIFAANNVLGEACLIAIRENDLRIPQDISLGIFDDIPWASLTAPSITAVSQPAYHLGNLSVKRLIQRLGNKGNLDEAPVEEILTPKLIVRESCGAIPLNYW
jgi:DNA-binding LacI/PurR family transcriptional regulator